MRKLQNLLEYLSSISRTKQIALVLVASLVLFALAFYISPYYATFIVGDSMEPEIKHHDMIILSSASEPQVGDTVDISNPNDNNAYDIIHEVEKVNETHVQTGGVNNGYSDPPAKKENVNGVVVMTITPPEFAKESFDLFMPSNYQELEKAYTD